jgi:hypothetical protein
MAAMPETPIRTSSRGRAQRMLVTIVTSAALIGAASVLAPGAGATPPFHCVGSPPGQDCTHGSDPGGGGWTAPDHYNFLGTLDNGSWDELERSDGAIPGPQDFATVVAATGYTVCTWGVTGKDHKLTSKIDCQ